MIYADNNATTKPEEEVLAAMKPYFLECFANPASSYHQMGRRAEEAVELARAEVALLIGAEPSQIVFTSGGTESCFFALLGAWGHFSSDLELRRAINLYSSGIEHPAVRDALATLESSFLANTRMLMLEGDGAFESPRGEERPFLLSGMLANNETGIIYPESSYLSCFENRPLFFHSDCTQAVGKIPFSFRESSYDAISFSAHKFGGPKGIGVLAIKKDANWKPMMSGGGQERGLRGGTLAVPLIAGIGKAAEIRRQRMESGDWQRIAVLRDALEESISSRIPDAQINGAKLSRLANTTSVEFESINSHKLRDSLAARQLVISSGSACASSKLRPSPVLQAMGRSLLSALSTVRISLGIDSTEDEVAQLVDGICEEVEKQRNLQADSLDQLQANA